MKKAGIAIGILFGSLFIIWAIGRLAGFWGWYNVPTPANEPGIMMGDKIIVSSFKKPALYSFVVYKNRMTDSLSMIEPGDEIKRHDYVHRLCGMPGDILEMKKSVLYVNGKNFDEDLDLKLAFLVDPKERDKVNDEDFSIEKGEINVLYNAYNSAGTTIILLDRNLRKKYQQLFSLVPYYFTDTSAGAAFKWYDKNTSWTTDNFGPLKIPAGSAFVMGDNRLNALDSRYTGFIAMKDISGTVINK